MVVSRQVIGNENSGSARWLSICWCLVMRTLGLIDGCQYAECLVMRALGLLVGCQYAGDW